MKKLLFALLFMFLSSSALQAEQVTVAWDRNTELDLAGYELHYGEASGSYIINVVVPDTLTAYTVGGLEQGKEYFFALKAFDTSGNKSGFSSEISYDVPIRDTEAPASPIVINIPEGSAVEINISPLVP